MPRPGPDKPLWVPCRILADVGALCGAVRALGVPCRILVDETTSALCGVPAKLAVTGSARGVSSNC
jgi:hypothetical protein